MKIGVVLFWVSLVAFIAFFLWDAIIKPELWVRQKISDIKSGKCKPPGRGLRYTWEGYGLYIGFVNGKERIKKAYKEKYGRL